jgi:hypothetical protein
MLNFFGSDTLIGCGGAGTGPRLTRREHPMKNGVASLHPAATGLLKDFVFLGGACLIGMTLAAAAIGLAPETTIDPGLRTLAQQTMAQRGGHAGDSLAACRVAGRSGAATTPSVVCEE